MLGFDLAIVHDMQQSRIAIMLLNLYFFFICDLSFYF